MATELELRKKIVDIHKKLYALGFAVANDGNTSVKLKNDTFLITPKGLDKTKLKPADIVVVNGSGKKIKGPHDPSSEIWLHLYAYRARPTVSAIVHSHPPFSIAASLAGVSLEELILPEVILAFGKIPTAPYKLTGTKEMASGVAEKLASSDGVILERHGALTVGNTLDDALAKLERIEHTAKILTYAKLLGGYHPLLPSEVTALSKLTNPIS